MRAHGSRVPVFWESGFPGSQPATLGGQGSASFLPLSDGAIKRTRRGSRSQSRSRSSRLVAPSPFLSTVAPSHSSSLISLGSSKLALRLAAAKLHAGANRSSLVLSPDPTNLVKMSLPFCPHGMTNHSQINPQFLCLELSQYTCRKAPQIPIPKPPTGATRRPLEQGIEKKPSQKPQNHAWGSLSVSKLSHLLPVPSAPVPRCGGGPPDLGVYKVDREVSHSSGLTWEGGWSHPLRQPGGNIRAILG